MHRYIRGLYTIVFISLYFIGCSSSTVSKRYNKIETEEDAVTKSVRFTSDNDVGLISFAKKEKEITVSNYSKEFDEEPYDDVLIDTKEFIKSNKVPASLISTLTKRERVLFEVVGYLETPYQYGGNNYQGIDCSAFTQNVFNKALKINLPRTASEQYKVGQSEKTDLVFGDLIFFNTRKESYPGHVGLYLGNDLFAHASSSQGVTVSSLKSSYYAQRYVGARRIGKISK
ncbi:MAG: C40 family peptidase [Melioribacteraceae bacterium]|nr:C40 family peptidase [Melioribacteraceae bacterium]